MEVGTLPSSSTCKYQTRCSSGGATAKRYRRVDGFERNLYAHVLRAQKAGLSAPDSQYG